MSTWTEPVQCIAAVVASQAAAAHQGRVNTMGQTIAEALRAEGEREGERRGELRSSRKTLQVLLEDRFGSLPTPLVQRIMAITDVSHLEAATRQVLRINALDELQL